MNFVRKRSQIPPPPGADHGREQPGYQCLVSGFSKKFKMADEADSSVSGEEGHSGTT